MSLNKFVSSGGAKQHQKFRREWNWRTFPLLSLPDEMISHIFSFLPIKDRMRARVNKRLNEIEMETQHYVAYLNIFEVSLYDPLPEMEKNDQCIIFYKERSYSSDSVRRIIQNVYPDEIRVSLSGSKKFHRQVYNIIASFAKRFAILTIKIDNDEMKGKIMVDNYFLELARNVRYLRLNTCAHMVDNITPEALHEVYEILSDSDNEFYRMDIIIDDKKCISFLSLIGITNINGNFFSSREGLEVYRLPYTDDTQEYHIFDGNVQMQLEWEMIEMWMFMTTLDEDEYDDWYEQAEYPVFFRRHDTAEQLEQAKNTEGFEKLDDFFSSN